jgi:putative peptide zinc metalloprotease protein
MADSLYSPSWYRAAGLKPRLRGHVEIHRHHYRGELWYVLQDHLSGKFQRFTPVAYQIIGLMNGKRTVQEIWEQACSRLGADVPTQEEMIRLLTQLHLADALQSDVIPDTLEMLKRYEKQRFSKLKQNLRSPLFMRFPLLDPEKFLTRFQSLVRPVFSWPGFILWLIVVGFGVFFAGVHWSELTMDITDRILSPSNLAVMWLTFPFLKAFHEFAHAFAVKIKGGEVHEMGIMMLVFTPIPYVDASAASSFREKRDRVIVGAAGLAVEIFIAALALFAWINMEPGPARSLTYNIIFIAGVSSLFFNGNPLLRYDAYYVLSDFLEIPNLGMRGNRYFLYLLQKHVLGIKEAEPPLHSHGERFWFVAYTVLSFIYRVFVYAAIILFVAGKFFFIGILFACWGMLNMFVIPAWKGVKFLLTSQRLARNRTRAVLASGLVIVLAAVIIGLVPVPLGTTTEGVVWLPEKSFVRAETDGFVEHIIAEPGKEVGKGDPLIQCSDPLLPAQIRLLEAQMREMTVVYDTQMISDKVKAEITLEEIAHIEAKLKDAREREEELTIYSGAEGIFILPMAEDLPLSYVRRGQLMGYVMDRSVMTARVVVSQADVDMVRQNTRGVKVRFPENLSEKVKGVLKREVPAATDELPGLALSREGGGEIAVDPREGYGNKAFQKLFLFDIELPDYQGICHVGGRIHVRFDHGLEPISFRWYRELRQLFLKRFNV